MGVLLQRAEAPLGYLHGRGTGVDVQVLGSPQIQNLYGAVGLEHQVVGAQIPVDKPCLVYPLHGLDGRKENLPCPFPGQGAGFLQMVLQGLALDKIHDDIGSFILLEQIPHPDHLGDFADPGHFPGLLQEHFPAAVPGGAADLGRGKVCLDGHLALQGQVPADIGDAEAALAQNGAHHIFAVQNQSRLQGIGIGAPGPRAIPAVGTGALAGFFHAMKATGELHTKHFQAAVLGGGQGEASG